MKLKKYLNNINERKHFMMIYSKEMESLDDAFNAISSIKMEDRYLQKKLNSIKINIKYIQGLLRKV